MSKVGIDNLSPLSLSEWCYYWRGDCKGSISAWLLQAAGLLSRVKAIQIGPKTRASALHGGDKDSGLLISCQVSLLIDVVRRLLSLYPVHIDSKEVAASFLGSSEKELLSSITVSKILKAQHDISTTIGQNEPEKRIAFDKA